jgi:hypothetical protein
MGSQVRVLSVGDSDCKLVLQALNSQPLSIGAEVPKSAPNSPKFFIDSSRKPMLGLGVSCHLRPKSHIANRS